MANLVRICVTLSLLLASLAASAQTLWNGTEYGMSVEEVRKKIPEAKPGNGDRVVSGAEELLRLEKIIVAGTQFEVSFFFLKDKLTQVNFSTPQWGSNEENLLSFDRVVTEFRTKYGQETERTVSNQRFGLSANAEWVSGDTQIWVTITPVTAITSMLNLGFRPASLSSQ